jgi:CRP/FNR family transcriptional regulator, cyclic AMP receptor protein
VDTAQLERVALSRGWLSGQPSDFQSRILGAARPLEFSKGESLFHAGDAQGGIYGVARGGIGISIPMRDGTMALAHIARAGVWFGHGPLFSRRPRTLSFAATEPSVALYLSLADIDRIAADSPAHARSVGAVADFGSAIAMAVVPDLLIRRAERRIAAVLLRVTTTAEGLSPDDPEGFHLTQSQLGEMANASRDVVNRTLTLLASKGWLDVGYGRILIFDREGLSAFAAGQA